MHSYFAKALERLESATEETYESGKPSFANLKIMEYWVRLLRHYPNGRSSLFVDSFFDNRQKIKFIETLDSRLENVEVLDKCNVFYSRRNWSVRELIQGFLTERDPSYIKPILTAFKYGVVDEQASSIMVEMVNDFAYSRIRMGCDDNDVSLRNAFDLKRTFDLSDDALELVLYLWLKDHKNLFFMLDRGRGEERDATFSSLCRGNYQRIMEATGLSVESIYSLCGKDSPLKVFQIIATKDSMDQDDLRTETKDTELYLAKDISDFLWGYAGNEKIFDYKVMDAPNVSFEQIKKLNPKVDYVLEFLKCRLNGDSDYPLHVLFYGREGTGKTELAKAVSARLGIRLLNIGTGDESMDKGTLLHHRVRSLFMADWECRKKGGIILMDEADQVLNYSEKGFLNNLFENVKTPVIWIANNIDKVEKSTRRRFNYAMEFSSFGLEERESIWKSVLKSLGVENLLSNEQIHSIAENIPVMAGSATLAVQQARKLSSLPPENVIREVASAHAKLLDVPVKNANTGNGGYSLDCLHFTEDSPCIEMLVPMLKNFNEKWGRGENFQNENMNILLYGPPGTGKTAFAEYVASTLMERNLVVKRASDILGKYVGETEKGIRDVFAEAERDKSILFVDEADSLLEDRKSADRHWEVTQVNEFICQMDRFNGLFIIATNNLYALDPAVRRRFDLKVGLDYMTRNQVESAWKMFFSGIPDCIRFGCPQEIMGTSNLAVSDFALVRRKMRYMSRPNLSYDAIVQMMLDELACKEEHRGRRMGL